MKRFFAILSLAMLSTLLVWCTNLDIALYDPATSTVVLGQPAPNRYVADDAGLDFPESVFTLGTQLFVADSNNDRILIWNTIPTSNATPADVVLGIVDNRNVSGAPLAAAQDTMNHPNSVMSDGQRLFVVDADNHRILIWNEIPDSSGVVPDVVVGQDDFNSSDGSNVTGLSAKTFLNPNAVWSDGTRMYVVDNSNHRVLIWNSIPETNTDADIVLGQADFISRTQGTGASLSDLQFPRGVFVSNGKLIVGDGVSQRLLIWNTIPTTINEAASYELTTTDSGIANYFPNAIGGASGRLFSTEPLRYRVVFWNSFPSSTSVTPDGVLGTTGSSGVSATQMDEPWSVDVNSGKVVVADTQNNRVLIWNQVPSSSGTAADVAVGQAGFSGSTNNAVNAYPIVGSFPTFQRARKVVSDGRRLYLADMLNNRVLIWNEIPTRDGQLPDVVLGQSTLSGNASNGGSGTPTNASLYYPTGVYTDGTKLYVADLRNNRILGWNTIPTTNEAPADFVLGHGDFTSSTGGTLNRPWFVGGDGQRLFVADTNNDRVLIWNSLPTSNQSPDVVLGTGTSQVTQDSFSEPVSVATDGTRLYVCDRTAHRVLIWNTIPTTSGALPDLVLGQSTFTSGSSGTDEFSFSSPFDVHVAWEKLYVADGNNNRVLIWDTLPTQNGQAASGGFGQSSFTSNTVNQGGLSGSSLYSPRGLSSDSRYIYISDSFNDRVLMVPINDVQ